MKIAGAVWKYGDDVSTDLIFPGRYLGLLDEAAMGEHALEGADPEFHGKVRPGDIIVAGKNWGCGSSREHAVKCLKAKGIGAVIAKGIARIFYRNALNQGLLTIICPAAVDLVNAGETISIDLQTNTIETASGASLSFPPYPDFVKGLVQDGGLLLHVRKRLQDEGKIPR